MKKKNKNFHKYLIYSLFIFLIVGGFLPLFSYSDKIGARTNIHYDFNKDCHRNTEYNHFIFGSYVNDTFPNCDEEEKNYIILRVQKKSEIAKMLHIEFSSFILRLKLNHKNGLNINSVLLSLYFLVLYKFFNYFTFKKLSDGISFNNKNRLEIFAVKFYEFWFSFFIIFTISISGFINYFFRQENIYLVHKVSNFNFHILPGSYFFIFLSLYILFLKFKQIKLDKNF